MLAATVEAAAGLHRHPAGPPCPASRCRTRLLRRSCARRRQHAICEATFAEEHAADACKRGQPLRLLPRTGVGIGVPERGGGETRQGLNNAASGRRRPQVTCRQQEHADAWPRQRHAHHPDARSNSSRNGSGSASEATMSSMYTDRSASRRRSWSFVGTQRSHLFHRREPLRQLQDRQRRTTARVSRRCPARARWYMTRD